MGRLLLSLLLCSVFFAQTIAQNNRLVTTLRAGYWNDASIWNTGKMPDSSDVVLLNHAVIVNADVKCYALYTNGFGVNVLPVNKIEIIGRNDNTIADSIQTLSFASTSINETLQVGYIKNGLEYLFYGTKDATGKINKLTRAQYRKLNQNDTIMNLIYDDSVRIKAMYATINGFNDSSFFKFTYTDSLLITTRCKVDWLTETYTVRDIIPSKRSTNNYAPYGLMQNEGIDLNLGLIAGGFAAIGVGAIAVTFGSAALGAAAGYYLVSSTISAATTGAAIGGVLGASLFLNKATASTIDNYPKPIPPPINPAFNSLTLKNPKLIDPKWFGQELPLMVTFQKTITTPKRVLIQANVLNDGGSPIITRGVCWRADTLAIPTISDSKIQVVPGLNLFGVESNDLDADKTYAFRPFASNKNGITYGAVIKHKIPEGADTIKMLTDKGIWDAVFWGDGPNGINSLGVLTQEKNSAECPDLVTDEFRNDKCRFVFNAGFSGAWSILSYNRYWNSIGYLDCTATYETDYGWMNYPTTWEYISASRTIRKMVTIDDEVEIFNFVITNISDKELTGYYTRVADGASLGFLIFR